MSRDLVHAQAAVWSLTRVYTVLAENSIYPDLHYSHVSCKVKRQIWVRNFKYIGNKRSILAPLALDSLRLPAASSEFLIGAHLPMALDLLSAAR